MLSHRTETISVIFLSDAEESDLCLDTGGIMLDTLDIEIWHKSLAYFCPAIELCE